MDKVAGGWIVRRIEDRGAGAERWMTGGARTSGDLVC